VNRSQTESEPDRDPVAASTSIGIGTARGPEDQATDLRMLDVLTTALRCGVRLIDTAVNYRGGQSERVVGAAVRLARNAGVPREAVTVASKAGFVRPPSPFPSPGPAPEPHHPTDHCLAPACLRYHLACSLLTMGLESIDIYYLHNPERARRNRTDGEFLRLMTKAFSVLESAVAAGHVGGYGVATWSAGGEARLPLARLMDAARSAAGGDPHFRHLQAPLSLRRQEALEPGEKGGTSLVEECQHLGVSFVASASGGGAGNPALTVSSVHWAASRPGVSAALVGTLDVGHLEQLLRGPSPDQPVDDLP
jgi:aryl-alcohol dehydrogenase-like predicted oxidoreductase